VATVSVTQEISAPAELVWALVTDLPRMGEWSPENLGGEWVKGATGAAVGARFKGRNKNGSKAWSTSVKVNEVEAPKKLSFALMALGKNWCDWEYEITPTATGCSVTHRWVDHRSKVANYLGKLVSGVSDRAEHNRRNMEATLKNLKAAAEN
jgi:uncharacterized protein YndB with AHSA1/START domain